MGEKEFQALEGRLYIEGKPWDGNIRELPEDVEIITEGSPCQCLPLHREQARTDAIVASLLIVPRHLELVATTTAEAAEAFRELAQSMNQFTEMCREEIKTVVDMSKEDHPKWWHYFRYSKKLRIRRKYQKLIMQYTGLAALPL